MANHDRQQAPVSHKRLVNENPRQVAVDVLVQVAQGSYSNLALNAALKDHHLSDRDAALCTQLVYGVLQHRLLLEFWLKPFVKRPNKVQPWVLALLETAVYQRELLSKIPDHAIFNETIALAKQRGHEGTRRFVTGVLHALANQGVTSVDTIKDPLTRLSVRYSVPMPWIQRLRVELGDEKAQRILASLNQPAAQSIRINQVAGDRDAILTALHQSGLAVSTSEVSGDGLRVTKGHPVLSAAFQEGLFTIQDESAMLPVEALDVQPTDQVLDACAAPGGKTTQIAGYLDATAGGHVTGLDLYDQKVALIMNNAHRLHVADRVSAVKLDARQANEHFNEASFDRILVDAPCSGIGLLRRKPEIRYAKTLADSQELQQIQLGILDAVAPLVKKNGIIIYSTCTIVQAENDDVANAFVTSHPGFEFVTVSTTKHLKSQRSTPWLTIYPDDYGSDGFFICGFKRRD